MTLSDEIAKALPLIFAPEEFQKWWEQTFKKVIPIEEEPVMREMAQTTWEASRSTAIGIKVEDIIPEEFR